MPLFTIMERNEGTAYSGCDEISDRINVPDMDAAKAWAALWCDGQDITRIAGVDEEWYSPMMDGKQTAGSGTQTASGEAVKAGYQVDGSAIVVWMIMLPFGVLLVGVIWWVMSVAIRMAGGG